MADLTADKANAAVATIAVENIISKKRETGNKTNTKLATKEKNDQIAGGALHCGTFSEIFPVIFSQDKCSPPMGSTGTGHFTSLPDERQEIDQNLFSLKIIYDTFGAKNLTNKRQMIVAVQSCSMNDADR